MGSRIGKAVRRILKDGENKSSLWRFFKKYEQYSFRDGKCHDEKQFEASITRLYHTVEKGMAYIDYKAGFGKENVNLLITSLTQYSSKYDTGAFFYRTALDVLKQYIAKNKSCGVVDAELEEKINALPGEPNNCGGITRFSPWSASQIHQADYRTFVENRHSIRHFSKEPVDLERIHRAVQLARYTPSACNRQGWKVRIIADRDAIRAVLNHQNGNRGFGQEIDKLILITADLRCFNHDREMFQAYIDGGMYAMSMINSLYYERIGTVPLSAALTWRQEKSVREILGVEDAEVFIIFIGIGNYPQQCQTTRSERHPVDCEVI